jgi:hypothetical protein
VTARTKCGAAIDKVSVDLGEEQAEESVLPVFASGTLQTSKAGCKKRIQ